MRFLELPADAPRAMHVQFDVELCVVTDLVSGRHDPAGYVGMALDVRSDHEKRRPHALRPEHRDGGVEHLVPSAHARHTTSVVQ